MPNVDEYAGLAHPVDYKGQAARLAADVEERDRLLAAAEAATDEAYRQRNLAASLAARLAVALGIPAGVRIDEAQPAEWATLIQIDLPAGQVSWHVHQRESAALTGLPIATAPWDGHTPADRDARCVDPGDLPISLAEFQEAIR